MLVIASRDISHPEWAGGDVYLHQLTSRLSEMGHEIIILCNNYSGGDSFSSTDGIRIYRIRGGLLRPIRNVLVYSRLRKWPEIVVEEVEGPAGTFFSALYVKKPLIGLWHQPARKILFAQYPMFLATPLTALDVVYGRLLRHRAVVVPSLASAREVEKLGIPASRIFVVPGAPNSNPGALNAISSLKPPFFLTLGKYRAYKCFDHAILAMKTVVKKHPECNLVIAGGRNFSEERTLRRLSEDSGLQSNVRFLSLSNPEKNWALANCIALLVPSPIEGFSLASVEANSFGAPVIASSGVPDDVVVDGINGLRYEFGNIQELSMLMLRFLENPDRESWSPRCAKFSRQFTWEKSAKILQEVLESVAVIQSELNRNTQSPKPSQSIDGVSLGFSPTTEPTVPSQNGKK